MESFRTPISIDPSAVKIHYGSHIMLMGSCFSENIGNNLSNAKFLVDNNPFGIVYNPLSIKRGLTRLLDGHEYSSDELVLNQELWTSFDHHGRFSNMDPNACISSINHHFNDSKENISKVNFLFITFGTSYVYYLKSTGQIVTNCHKFPAEHFVRKRISVEEIVEEYSILITRLRQINPSIYIVFTVSPVRHWKDGVHENQLSKSILLLATERLCDKFDKTLYFPSYEIMMDDLRDYRFYDDDMFHPNHIAVNYIWKKFVNCFIESKTSFVMKEVENIVLARNHRPFNTESIQYKDFAKQILLKINHIQDQFQLSLHEEEKYFKSILG